MLHLETVEPHTLSVLNRIMGMTSLQQFSLVGGTTLSLRYGHRKSVDLDLFSHTPFDNDHIETAIRAEFGVSVEIKKTPKQFGIFCFIDKVKVDIVRFPHPLIAAIETEEGIRMYSDDDICAMKIQAMLGRGVKKDFWDIAELLKKYSLGQIIDWHKKKYEKQYLAISIPQALLYFDDADESEDPISLKGQTWESVKKSLQQIVSDFLA